jgi:hypothetical protein
MSIICTRLQERMAKQAHEAARHATALQQAAAEEDIVSPPARGRQPTLIIKEQPIRAQLARLLKQEELKWIQRAKVTDIKEGEGNTKFFHAKANGRH